MRMLDKDSPDLRLEFLFKTIFGVAFGSCFLTAPDAFFKLLFNCLSFTGGAIVVLLGKFTAVVVLPLFLKYNAGII